ncbi:hypothetical protein NQZ79_g3330 [Umbelopsis isabellina]|nr:hypothetical protein NQZ79_g3330 [Umbelopsis isabellina]
MAACSVSDNMQFTTAAACTTLNNESIASLGIASELLPFGMAVQMQRATTVLTDLPDDIMLYILNNFIPLIDLWQLLQVSRRFRALSKDVIRRIWKIDLQSSTESLFRVQFRGALITLDAISCKLPPLTPTRRAPSLSSALSSAGQSIYSRLGNGSALSMRTAEPGPLRITLSSRPDGNMPSEEHTSDLQQYADSLEPSPITPHDGGHNFWSSPSAEGSDHGEYADAVETHQEHPALAQFKAMAGSLIEEECLHQRIIRGIISHTHRYVLIENIDTRNRLRAAVDTIFHHVVFVSSGTHREDRWSRASAAAFVRLLKRLDTAIPSHGSEMTYTLSDNLKAFLEYSTYRLMAAKRRNHYVWAKRTIDTLSSCANLVGAALLVKMLTEPQVEGAIRKMCELLKDSQIPTETRRTILTTLLNGWLIDREPIYTDLCSLLQHEIDDCDTILKLHT